ncbi:membrane protein [Catellatospora sp. IY07-71]|uniref:DMT family transporter n=1 Tax=Catellatospora sp. IY07-71 TaxID=2728827 RepID=UPI001BB3B7F5|nr:DMT family transporter [Catellatospora sp. IY07-71]BCJ73226.1 membrane protein [Catellatospora sp. IY07-71]
MKRQAWLLLAAMSVLWGIPYLFIKIALTELSPPMVVLGRTLIAALVLLPLAYGRGALARLRGRWVAIGGLSLLHVVTPQLLITYGELHISSSLTALLLAGQPLFIVLLALRFDATERAGARKLLGLLAGLVGVAAVVGFDLGGGDRLQLIGGGLVLLAGLSYAGATMLVRKKLADVPPLGVVAGTTGIASVLLLPAGLLTAPAALPGWDAAASVLVLGLLSTALAFMVYYRLIALSGAASASLVSYTSPAVSVALGVALLGEPLSPATVLGFALILVGSWLATRKPTPASTASATPTPRPAPALAGRS